MKRAGEVHCGIVAENLSPMEHLANPDPVKRIQFPKYLFVGEREIRKAFAPPITKSPFYEPRSRCCIEGQPLFSGENEWAF